MKLRYGLSSDGTSFTARVFNGFEQCEDLSLRSLEADERIGAVIDIEATGLDLVNDETIEVAARKFVFNCKTGAVVAIGETFTGLQQPSKPLEPIITKITGLTDGDLVGQKIDWKAFDAFIDEVSLLVAHNAQFDRAFIDRSSIESQKTIWGCSWYQVPWRDHFPVQSQEALALMHGFYYEGHRALNDVDALLKLIQLSPDDKHPPYLLTIIEEARKPTYWIFADNARREKKDLLKRRRYWWDPEQRVWKKRFSNIEDVNKEMGWLGSEVYHPQNLARVETVKPVDNFKNNL